MTERDGGAVVDGWVDQPTGSPLIVLVGAFLSIS